MPRNERPSVSRDAPGRARLIWHGIAHVWACLWSLWTVLVFFMAVPEWLGLSPASAQDIEDGIIVAVISVVMTGTAWLAAYGLSAGPTSVPALTASRPTRPYVPPPQIRIEKRPPLPRPGSAARQPMRQLTEAELGLAELLRRLSEVPNGPDTHVVEQAWRAATDAAARLRSIGARLEAVELAAAHGPAQERTTFEDGANSLQTHLDQGLDAYRGLVAAAGRLMLEAPVQATEELVEATESLTGLAEAWRELSDGTR